MGKMRFKFCKSVEGINCAVEGWLIVGVATTRGEGVLWGLYPGFWMANPWLLPPGSSGNPQWLRLCQQSISLVQGNVVMEGLAQNKRRCCSGRLYTRCLMVPSSTTSSRLPLSCNPVHTMTDWLILPSIYCTQTSMCLSPWHLHTRARPYVWFHLNLDSLVKKHSHIWRMFKTRRRLAHQQCHRWCTKVRASCRPTRMIYHS